MIKVITDEIYAKMVKEAESAAANGHTYTRFEMFSVLEKMNIELNGESVKAIEKLYADGFIKE